MKNLCPFSELIKTSSIALNKFHLIIDFEICFPNSFLSQKISYIFEHGLEQQLIDFKSELNIYQLRS